MPAAYRIVTARLVIRCWSPVDAPLLKVAIDSSLPELRVWMPWALAEPTPMGPKVELLRRFRGQFDLGIDFVYGVFDREEHVCLGGTGLHTRQGEDRREIGYWIATPHTRKGYATELTQALTRVALRVVGVPRVEVHCDPTNAASIAVARKVGLKFEGTLRASHKTPQGLPRDTAIFAAVTSDLDGLPATPVQAYGVMGEPLL